MDLLRYASRTKVCWVSGCFSFDILKATEVTVTNGVDVLSLSLGGGRMEYYRDSIAVGAHVMLCKWASSACPAVSSLRRCPARSCSATTMAPTSGSCFYSLETADMYRSVHAARHG